MKNLYLLLIILWLASCQTRTERNTVNTPASPVVIETFPLKWPNPVGGEVVKNTDKNSTILFSLYRCLAGTFDPSAKFLFLSCSNSPDHPHFEIYSYQFSTKKLKRLTYQDSPALSPMALSNDKIIFSTGTDEIKEREDLFIGDLKRKYLKPDQQPLTQDPYLQLPPSEVYQTDFNGEDFQRLTDSSGYDSGLAYSLQKEEIFFSSSRDSKTNNGDTEIFKMSSTGRQVSKLTQLKGFNGQVQVSDKAKKMVWVHRSNQNTKNNRSPKEAVRTTQLYLAGLQGESPKALSLPEGLHWMPYWHPSGEWLIFSSNFDNEESFHIYAVKKDGSCLQPLTTGKNFDISPVFRPDGSSLVFSRWNSSAFDVIEVPFSPSQSCANL